MHAAMADDADATPDLRTFALLLSGLVLAEDGQLESFRTRRKLSVDIEHLTRLRDVLRELAPLVAEPDDARWGRLEQAHRVLAPVVESEPGQDAEDVGEEASTRDDAPPTLREMLDAPLPDEQLGEFPPSPWTAISRAVERQTPAKPEPPPDDPAPPPIVRKPTTEPPEAPADEPLPFSERPNPHTPDAKSLPPTALASVIAGLPPMTVVSYAAFCASCEAMPQRLAETHAKFGVIGENARASLDDAWRRKLDEDARLHDLWQALTDQFRTWLTMHR